MFMSVLRVEQREEQCSARGGGGATVTDNAPQHVVEPATQPHFTHRLAAPCPKAVDDGSNASNERPTEKISVKALFLLLALPFNSTTLGCLIFLPYFVRSWPPFAHLLVLLPSR